MLSGVAKRVNQPPNPVGAVHGNQSPGPFAGDRGGSYFFKMVGAAGFEPTISRPQIVRDTKLRHAPQCHSV
jgi:hypothetical protein